MGRTVKRIGVIVAMLLAVAAGVAALCLLPEQEQPAPPGDTYNLVRSLYATDTATRMAILRGDMLRRLQQGRIGAPLGRFPELPGYRGLQGLVEHLPRVQSQHDTQGLPCLFLLPDGSADTLLVYPPTYRSISIGRGREQNASTTPLPSTGPAYTALYQEKGNRYWMIMHLDWGYPGHIYGPYPAPAAFPAELLSQIAASQQQFIADQSALLEEE